MGGLSHTASGDIASFRTPSRVPIESLKFRFLPKQAAGTPSPENPIPIEGWTGLNGHRCGKNLLNFNKNFVSNPYTLAGLTYTVHYNEKGDFQYINIKGAKTSNNAFYNLNFYSLNTSMDPGHYIVYGTIPGIVDFRVYEMNPNETLLLNTTTGIYDFETHEGSTASWMRLQIMTNEYIDVDVYPILMQYPGSAEPIPITFPVAGTNKADPSAIILESNLSLSDGVYSNTAVDTRDYSQLQIQLWKTTGTYIKSLTTMNVTTTGTQSLTFEVDDPDCHYIAFKHNGAKKDFRILVPFNLGLGTYTLSINLLSADPTTIGGFRFKDVQLEVGDTAHAYEPYSSDNTFYGGYIDPVAGEIVAEYGSYTFTGVPEDNITYTKENTIGGKTRHQFNTTVLDGIAKNTSTRYAYSDIASANLWDSPDITNDNLFYIGTPTKQVALYVLSSECDATVESFSAWLSNHPWTIVYQLATPIHIPFPAEDLQAFLDHNNFWSDANDITEVTYAVTESKDILATRKKAMDFDIGHHKKVKWNQLIKELTLDYWKPYKDVNTLTANDGELTLTLNEISSVTYQNSIITNTSARTNCIPGHKYYFIYYFCPSWDTYGIGFSILNQNSPVYPQAYANTYTKCSGICVHSGNSGMHNVMLAYSGWDRSWEVGSTIKCKTPIMVDMTLMFGEGNEPSTTDEFERICELNGINLTTYQPYDEGSDRWLIIP